MGFTYYGDLLGISAYYKLDPNTAYRRLNDFYNTTFFSLESYCTSNNNVEVLMVSDSLLIWGENSGQILKELQKIYLRLINQGLLLRGAIVMGKLEFDPRRTIGNFRKELPTNNALARAVGLENTQKGARLLIENSLASELLTELQDWTTNEGYVRNINRRISFDDISRRICPTPDQSTYEFLYFWETEESTQNNDIWTTDNYMPRDYSVRKNELQQIAHMLKKNLTSHYKETIRLIDHSKKRDILTHRFLSEF